MRSSVLHFNRFPALAAAAARRIGGSAMGAYVDDFTTPDFLQARGSGQRFTNVVIRAMGGELGPPLGPTSISRPDPSRSCWG